MEFEILHGIQALRSDLLDQIMIFITKLGDAGLFWIGLGLVLAIIPKTRKCGLSVLGAMALTFILGNLILKNLVARPRPFTVDASVPLIIPQPGEFSFPSGHTMNGFAAATTIFLYYHKAGIVALLLAASIAFSRMYLFVHYPTDILGGIIVGVFDAWLIYTLVNKWAPAWKKKNS